MSPWGGINGQASYLNNFTVLRSCYQEQVPPASPHLLSKDVWFCGALFTLILAPWMELDEEKASPGCPLLIPDGADHPLLLPELIQPILKEFCGTSATPVVVG